MMQHHERWRRQKARPAWSGRRALTLVEVLVVAVLGAIAMGGGMLLWSRTSQTVVKGDDMMDLQLILRSVQEQLRSDVRTMTALSSCAKHQVTFTSRLKGTDVTITWTYQPAAKRLVRRVEGESERDFQAAGFVALAEFSPLVPQVTGSSSAPSAGASPAEGIRLALELQSGKDPRTASRLAVVSQFTSRSIAPPFEIVR
ncbi:MAG TPA: prepilin-type N-terminal cleavage/methylation domain-containing protein [Candidatus Ozemobacteraceae bacterium]|nr:prepilin-type N-terminal cleavage/methylation domain-containing protein [Candidatus Ozemobacteraceae bacterium]